MKELAIHCSLVEHQKNNIVLALGAQHESLKLATSVANLRSELQSLFGDKLSLEVTVSKDPVNSPAQEIKDIQQHNLNNAESSIDSDVFVQVLKRHLQAELVPGSVQSKTIESKQEGKE